MVLTINDHIQNTLPRSSVYSFSQGSDLFIRQDFIEVYPDNSAGAGGYTFNGDKKITFILASPQKNMFSDLRSHCIKFKLQCTDAAAGNIAGIAEPAGESWIDSVVIRIGDQVVENIRYYNHLACSMRRTLMDRNCKKSNWIEGWDIQTATDAQFQTEDRTMNPTLANGGGVHNKEYIMKLNLSGI